jgi:AcrR family transcriptional regulator
VTSVLPPARRTRPPNRRELILAAATELFAVRGYEYVGLSEIAEEVAVQPSALYRHFAGQGQLLAEILRACATWPNARRRSRRYASRCSPGASPAAEPGG